MPNGNPDFHLTDEPKLEAFFSPIAELLTNFSRRYNLKLQKYYHEGPSWDFTFKHPQGGVGKIDVCRDTDQTVILYSCWWYDDYDKTTRFLKSAKHEPIPKDAQLLSKVLEDSLKLILSWQFGQWDREANGFAEWQKTWNKKQFEMLNNDYPVPKLN